MVPIRMEVYTKWLKSLGVCPACGNRSHRRGKEIVILTGESYRDAVAAMQNVEETGDVIDTNMG